MSKLESRPFEFKTVVITGAGSGLGKALAHQFATQGWQLVLSDSNLESVNETLAEVKGQGATAIAAKADVTNTDELATLRQQAFESFKGIDVLINNAGVSAGGEFDTVDRATLDWAFNINFFGVVNGYQAFAQDLKQCSRAHVVNIASFAAIANPPASGAYNASKAAVVSFSETIRGELAYSPVGVSVVCPSFFRTNLLKDLRSNEDKVKKVASKLMDKSPLNADDIAKIIYQSVMDNRFKVIPHKDSTMHDRIKRWFPEFFFNKIKKMTRYLVD
ncbi:SDR family NAD(P)-dependent oxidoreductase [Kangiella sp. HZ709]|uniref:SDR family NAD(P)-dependent oxidoreductase n=1 Tax=Kangiella sp. HZ709 TaxID=2666328 RepID=UPI0018A2219A|nr:SDR family NAD(P)-dependent oxidoreductase [Kangiella sp. HZ709]